MAETDTLDAPATTTGTAGTDWRASLPEDLRAEKSLESFKDVGALAKSYVETKRMVGDALKVPGPEAKPEERAAFFTKLGRPEAPDKYAIKPPVFPEEMGIGWDSEAQAAFLAEMHDAGLTNAQVQRALDWYGKYMLGAHDTQIRQTAAERKAAEAALRTAWGSAWDRNVGLARAAVHKLFAGDEDVLAAFEAKGNNPNIVKGLALVGEMLVERGEIRGDEHRGGRTAEEIEAELTAIRNDPKSVNDMKAGDRILALTRELLAVRDRGR